MKLFGVSKLELLKTQSPASPAFIDAKMKHCFVERKSLGELCEFLLFSFALCAFEKKRSSF